MEEYESSQQRILDRLFRDKMYITRKLVEIHLHGITTCAFSLIEGEGFMPTPLKIPENVQIALSNIDKEIHDTQYKLHLFRTDKAAWLQHTR